MVVIGGGAGEPPRRSAPPQLCDQEEISHLLKPIGVVVLGMGRRWLALLAPGPCDSSHILL
jgi:hypothetical protein